MKTLVYVICLLLCCQTLVWAQTPEQVSAETPAAAQETPSAAPEASSAPEEAGLTPEEEQRQKELELKVMLFAAIMDEDYNRVQQLLGKKAPVNITDSEGLSPLHYSVCFNHTAITKLLINSKANLDARDIEGYTPIYYAAQNGNEAIFDLLLWRGAKTDPTEKTTLLHMAAYGGNTAIIKKLLDKKMSPEAVDDQGLLPIDYAAANSKDEAVILLADNMPEEKISLNTLLPLLAGDNKELLKNLLARIKNKNRLNSDNDSPARIAAKYSGPDMLSFLESEGVNITYVAPNGQSALQEAAAAGNLDAVKLLVEKGMDPNSRIPDTGFTPVMTACCAGNSDVVKYLAEHGADTGIPSAKGTYLIHEAAYKGNLELVIYFTEHGTDVNTPDANGVTALFNALDANQPGVVGWLLSHGADLKLKTKTGDTALHYAVLSDNEELFKQVIPSVIGSVNSANSAGVTPLMNAAMIGNLPIIKALLAVGARLSDTDHELNSLLHYGVLSNKKDVVQFLLSRDPNINKVNKAGETPLMIAERNKFEAITELLAPKPKEPEAPAPDPGEESPQPNN